MSDEIVIRVENLGKRYRIQHNAERQRYTALRDVIAHKLKAPFQFLRRSQKSEVRSQTSDLRPPTSARSSSEDFWALRDVSFEVRRGEVVGIIGRNGAGKSTLLKILSRITEPTEGRIRILGRVASLLEVGTGFHPELTGRENIFLNGAILGMHRAEIKRKFDEIVAFAEVEKFLDTPVKRYSSGMYVRLAFAVAAHLEPEILIVDEVLAVGDAQFQKKCLRKMQSVSTKEGRTVLFVSHNMVAVQTLCRRALWLREGQLVADKDVATVVADYLRGFHGQDDIRQWNDPKTAPGNEALRIKSIRLEPESKEGDQLITMQTPFQIETEYWVLEENRQLHITYHLLNDQGITVLTSGSPQFQQIGLNRAICRMPGNLLNSGGYYLKLLVVENGNKVTYTHESIASFTVVDVAERKSSWMGREPGVVQPVLTWQQNMIQK
jgi:lipopolysaccharide transport system ATP-binding protein